MSRRLTQRQSIFISEYVQHGVAKGAAIAAGYSDKTSSEIAHQLLKKEEVKLEIARRNKLLQDELLISRKTRLYDNYDSGILDKEENQRQRKRIRDERSHFGDLLEQANLKINDATLETAKSVLELATNAKTLWLSRTPYERRNFLESILSNQYLDGLTVRYEMRKSFKRIAGMNHDGGHDWTNLEPL